MAWPHIPGDSIRSRKNVDQFEWCNWCNGNQACRHQGQPARRAEGDRVVDVSTPGTSGGNGLDILATLVEARETKHYPMEGSSTYCERSEFAGARLLKPKTPQVKLKPSEFSLAVGRALRSAGRRARETARMHGTSIYISRNGKVVAIKP